MEDAVSIDEIMTLIEKITSTQQTSVNSTKDLFEKTAFVMKHLIEQQSKIAKLEEQMQYLLDHPVREDFMTYPEWLDMKLRKEQSE